MEESEKRRQRLMAMRLEAAQAGAYNGPEASGLPLGGLSNPLIEREAPSTTPLLHNAPRFDFYTDPMSAFSGNKRNNLPPQVSQGHRNVPPRTPYQGMPPGPLHQNLGPRTFQTPPPHFNQGPPRSPLEPFSQPQAYPPRAWGPPPPNFYQGNNFTGSRFGQGDPGPPRPPKEVASPFNTPQGNPPRPWGGSGNSFNYTTPPNSYRGSNFTSPSSGNQNRNQGHNSPNYSSGRGRGWTSGYPSGRKGGRGHGSAASPELRPDKYYSKQMVEDPWEWMTPVIWEHGKVQDSEQSEHPKPVGTNKEVVEDGGARQSEESWPPKSIGTKKAKYTPGASNQPSLAEYLAASFNEPIEDKNDQEGS